MPPFDGHEAPTSLGSIYGYRYWYLVDGGRLVSVSTRDSGKGIPWADGENTAKCIGGRGDLSYHVGRPPEPPQQPLILQQAAAGSHFGEFVSRARLGGTRGFSFPTTESGDVLLPQYARGPNHEARLAEARESYQRACQRYDDELAYYEQLKAEAAAEHAKTHQVPVLGCTCGFYMVKEPTVAKKYTQHGKDPLIFGVVEGYGKVVVGESGWRFEKARIRGVVMTERFMHNRAELKLDKKTSKLEMTARFVGMWNEFSENYSKTEFYPTTENLRAEWDEKVKNS